MLFIKGILDAKLTTTTYKFHLFVNLFSMNGRLDDSATPMEKNGSILLAPKMRHILASLDSVASAAEKIQKEA